MSNRAILAMYAVYFSGNPIFVHSEITKAELVGDEQMTEETKALLRKGEMGVIDGGVSIVMVDSLSMLEERIIGMSPDRFTIDDFGPSPVVWVDYERPPLPKPPNTKLRIKQPKRQSFRQSMRSVNRNR